MAEYLINNDTLTDIADEIRVLNGTEETLTPVEMKNELDTFNTDMNTVVTEQNAKINELQGANKEETSKAASNVFIDRNSAIELLRQKGYSTKSATSYSSFSISHVASAFLCSAFLFSTFFLAFSRFNSASTLAVFNSFISLAYSEV